MIRSWNRGRTVGGRFAAEIVGQICGGKSMLHGNALDRESGAVPVGKARRGVLIGQVGEHFIAHAAAEGNDLDLWRAVGAMRGGESEW